MQHGSGDRQAGAASVRINAEVLRTDGAIHCYALQGSWIDITTLPTSAMVLWGVVLEFVCVTTASILLGQLAGKHVHDRRRVRTPWGALAAAAASAEVGQAPPGASPWPRELARSRAGLHREHGCPLPVAAPSHH